MMMAIIMTITLVVGLASLLLLLVWRSFLLSPSLRLPPGPRPLPIVGNLLMMRKYASIHDFANEMRSKYGSIVTFWIGSKLVVIISGPDIIHEAMITQGSIFSGRPRSESTKILHYNQRTFTLAQGERHRFLRKLLISEVLSNKRVAGFRPIREQELDILIESLKQELKGDDKHKGGFVTNFRALILSATCNLLVGVLFGRRMTLDEYTKLDDVMMRRFVLGSRSLGNVRQNIPLLAWLPDRKGIKLQYELREEANQLLNPLIEERKQALKSGKTTQLPTSLVDTLLALQSGEIEQTSVDIVDTDIALLCLDILSAGTDTTALNLEYCMGNLMNHPEIQEKLAQEISSVVGSQRAVNEDDLSRLPYLQAVVKEVLRRHSPARVSPPRRNLSATKLAGYDIPVNTTILSHLEGVAFNPQIWEDPLEFKPERFLNRTVDVTGSTEVALVPFGVGRRICPAVNVAFIHAELFLARLIQTFEWKPVSPGQLVDLTPGWGLTSPMKHPLAASLRERF